MATQFGSINNQQENGYQSAFGGGSLSAPRLAKAVTYEHKADKFSLLAIAFIAGWIACDATNGVSKLWSEHGQLQVIKTQTVPKLQAKVAQQGCTIDKIAGVAADAIVANKSGAVGASPTLNDIQPCAPVKPVVPTAAPKK